MDSVFVTAHHCMYRSCASHMMVICHYVVLWLTLHSPYFSAMCSISHTLTVLPQDMPSIWGGREERGGRGEGGGRGKGEGKVMGRSEKEKV